MRNTGAWVKDADVMTTSYGDLDVLGTIVTAVNLTSPIKASVNLRRNVLGLYVPLPCIKNFGSCEYPDLCVYGYTNKENCPPLLDEHDIPCRCPITAGTYNFPGGQFQVPKTRWATILAGKYKGTVKFFSKNQLIACYKFFYSLE
ncbi:Ganglioside GM2 activator precursor, putative [Pediculus humanus corporis]|uniref:Ganglioside GM2 activator, putative n=1 Tax=Pediculus humanus subsp. corporis TaxID=121224 RepID=E0VT68_PEDHC|nr:Ganglioside GM2 activator precursor, putative [Pediculus humanus corporis]EEB16574.1 Ganglioside GM2 activator precursor, putative [Pediculus humanus corporis]